MALIALMANVVLGPLRFQLQTRSFVSTLQHGIERARAVRECFSGFGFDGVLENGNEGR
jgi:hypothetical protein